MTKTNQASVVVVPPPGTNAVAGGEALREIRGPVAVPSGWGWLLWVLAACAAAWLARAWWRRRQRPAPPPQIPVVPAHERAQERLRAARSLLDQPGPFCTEVSGAIRAYLEDRFQLHAPDRTTEEFLDELQSSPLLMWGQKQTLGEFLGRCDLVKFARYEPSRDELEALIETAQRLVEETQVSATGPDALPGTSATGEPPKTGTPSSTVP